LYVLSTYCVAVAVWTRQAWRLQIGRMLPAKGWTLASVGRRLVTLARVMVMAPDSDRECK
jgi:hypothetical protein